MDGELCLSGGAVSWPNDESLLIPLQTGSSYTFAVSFYRVGGTYGAVGVLGLCQAEEDKHFNETVQLMSPIQFTRDFAAACDTFGVYLRADTNGTVCFDDLKLTPAD